ncbi:hypothetical protein FD723_41190 (plasmid) [Nostoc sp. C052]|uniref:hypothetical protein n=1 Tax=Nostoc sp. C052 TaxID=2576902 RepID=UPI0015C40A4E|nr:hypothetical protein [Nostoc sp. C052]QLE46625.1 hypothetical protein FD723_41190 [Nostoc sp. C052]
MSATDTPADARTSLRDVARTLPQCFRFPRRYRHRVSCPMSVVYRRRHRFIVGSDPGESDPK